MAESKENTEDFDLIDEVKNFMKKAIKLQILKASAVDKTGSKEELVSVVGDSFSTIATEAMKELVDYGIFKKEESTATKFEEYMATLTLEVQGVLIPRHEQVQKKNDDLEAKLAEAKSQNQSLVALLCSAEKTGAENTLKLNEVTEENAELRVYMDEKISSFNAAVAVFSKIRESSDEKYDHLCRQYQRLSKNFGECSQELFHVEEEREEFHELLDKEEAAFQIVMKDLENFQRGLKRKREQQEKMATEKDPDESGI